MYNKLKFNADLHTQIGRYSKLNLACPCFNRKTEATQRHILFYIVFSLHSYRPVL